MAHVKRERRAVKRWFRRVVGLGPIWLVFTIQRRLLFLLKAMHRGTSMNWRATSSYYDFRRNIHRLEKGLLFPQRKTVFAEAYITETVDFLSRIEHPEEWDPSTLAWGRAVLNEYFSVVEHTPMVADAHERFRKLELPMPEGGGVPYRSDERPALSVSFEDLKQLARRRRSVRFFEPRPVEVELVERAMEVAALAPSSCNRQAFRFVFFNEPKIVARLSALPGGVAGYEVPSIVVVIGQYRGYFDERDVKVPMIDSSLAVMSFLFALETLGLGAVCINWPSLPDRERRLRELIPIGDDEVVVMMIGIGYPDPEGRIAFSAKRDLAHLLQVGGTAER